MSLSVCYYLRIGYKFVKLSYVDNVLCNLYGVNSSEENYLFPEGNRVNWVDMLTDLLLELPSSKCKNDEVDINDIIEVVCHYNTNYVIRNVGSYIRCYYLMKVIGITIVAYYADLSMFADKEREYYRHLHNRDVWMEREELLNYMQGLDMTRDVEKSERVILQNLYYSMNHP